MDFTPYVIAVILGIMFVIEAGIIDAANEAFNANSRAIAAIVIANLFFALTGWAIVTMVEEGL